MAIKRITAANENLTSGRSRTEAQHYWAESHGKLVANGPNLRRYHHYFTLPEVYDKADPAPSYIGISMFWRDDPLAPPQQHPAGSPMDLWASWYSNQPGGSDDRQLFDREKRWPIDDQHADIMGEEHVIIEGAKAPAMVNAIFMVSRLPGLDHKDFFDHWINVHAAIASKLPGLRRYIVNPVVLEMLGRGSMTHDGWSEFWFDDYASFRKAYESPEWQAMEADGRTLFCEQKGVVIGHEYIQKDETWKPRDYGALSLSDDEIRARLISEGYKQVAADPEAPAKIKAAASKSMLAVWTADHLATFDDSRIDARPQR